MTILLRFYIKYVNYKFPKVPGVETNLVNQLHSGAKLHAVLPDSKNFEAGILKKSTSPLSEV